MNEHDHIKKSFEQQAPKKAPDFIWDNIAHQLQQESSSTTESFCSNIKESFEQQTPKKAPNLLWNRVSEQLQHQPEKDALDAKIQESFEQQPALPAPNSIWQALEKQLNINAVWSKIQTTLQQDQAQRTQQHRQQYKTILRWAGLVACLLIFWRSCFPTDLTLSKPSAVPTSSQASDKEIVQRIQETFLNAQTTENQDIVTNKNNNITSNKNTATTNNTSTVSTTQTTENQGIVTNKNNNVTSNKNTATTNNTSTVPTTQTTKNQDIVTNKNNNTTSNKNIATTNNTSTVPTTQTTENQDIVTNKNNNATSNKNIATTNNTSTVSTTQTTENQDIATKVEQPDKQLGIIVDSLDKHSGTVVTNNEPDSALANVQQAPSELLNTIAALSPNPITIEAPALSEEPVATTTTTQKTTKWKPRFELGVLGNAHTSLLLNSETSQSFDATSLISTNLFTNIDLSISLLCNLNKRHAVQLDIYPTMRLTQGYERYSKEGRLVQNKLELRYYQMDMWYQINLFQYQNRVGIKGQFVAKIGTNVSNLRQWYEQKHGETTAHGAKDLYDSWNVGSKLALGHRTQWKSLVLDYGIYGELGWNNIFRGSILLPSNSLKTQTLNVGAYVALRYAF